MLPYLLNGISLNDALMDITRIPITWPKEYGGILWYLYMLVGIYLIVPMISFEVFSKDNWLTGKVYLGLWFASAIVSNFRADGTEVLNSLFPGRSFDVFQYFTGFLGYFIFGANLMYGEYKEKRLLLILALIYLMIKVAGRFVNIEYGFLSIDAIVLSAMVFVAFKLLFEDGKPATVTYRMVKAVSKYSFGIYLSHILVFNVITKPLYTQIPNVLLANIMVISLTLIVSTFLTIGIGKIPYVRKIVGL